MNKYRRYFIVLRQSKIAFVHVPKTGSSTIKELARRESGEIYEEHCPAYKCICFVRNPFSRVYASFIHFLYDNSRNLAWKEKLEGRWDFNEFVENTLASIADWHFWSMERFLRRFPLAEVLRFENFGDEIMRLTGSNEVTHNARCTRQSYRDAYDEKSIATVSDLYAWDIQHLGYTF